MRLFYSRIGDCPAGFERRNPRFWDEASRPEPGVEAVLIDGDWPEIAEAYLAAGVSVERMAEPGGEAPPVYVVETPASQTVPLDERADVYVPLDWRDLPWVGGPSVMTLRKLGSMFAEKPVLNRAAAVAAIEAELKRREEAVEPPAE